MDHLSLISSFFDLWANTSVSRGFKENGNDSDFSNFTTNNKSKSSVAEFYPIIVAEMSVSAICLILSVIIYCILPEFRNVHGKNLISLSCCLLTTFIFLILDVGLRKRVSHASCFVIAVIIHLTFLATFFWTNVMSFDIWKTIASMKAKSETRNSSKKYIKYSVYAWTSTILTALPAIILEVTDLIPLKYKPKFAFERCWLNGRTAFAYYFNLPVGVILLFNLVMFSLTIRKLWIIKKMTAILPSKQHQRRLNLYLKLFLVMGITWITEFLPWVTGVYKLYALAGMLTALHGVLLFIIFVLKKRILRQIWEILRFGTVPEFLQKSSSSQTTKSSSGQQMSSEHLNMTNTPSKVSEYQA